MFTLNDDNSIYATRGDTVFFLVTAEENGEDHIFKAGDVLRFKVYGKKNAENVVLQKDFPVTQETREVHITLTEADTKFGEVISKPTDYWYEVELNPFTNPQTIIGYDEDGAKVFKLFPEGDDVPEFVPDPEDVRIIDTELDMTSTRPVQNQAVARGIASLKGDFAKYRQESTARDDTLHARMNDIAESVATEQARLDIIISGSTAQDGAEIADLRVGADGKTYPSAGTSVRTQIKRVSSEANDANRVVYENLGKPSTFSNGSPEASMASFQYFLYFSEEKYVQSLKPLFATETGTFSYQFGFVEKDMADDLDVVLLGEAVTANVGDSIPVDRLMTPRDFIVIHGNDDAVLKYSKWSNIGLSCAKIGRVENGKTKQIYELRTYHFAGDFHVLDIDGTLFEYIAEHTKDSLAGKTILAVGDSMVYGHNVGVENTWLAKMCGRTGANYINKGTNGAFITNRQYGGIDNSVYQKVCVPGSELYITGEELGNADYILVYAGTNDIANSVTVGEIDSADVSELCGALNAICNELISRAPSCKIGFITPYMRKGMESKCKRYVDAIKSVCEKYSIPVFDNARNGGICWANANQVSALTLGDTYHLNVAGMEYVSNKYESFLKML